MTPHNNTIRVLSNTSQRQSYIDNNRFGTTGWTAMDIWVSNVVVNGVHVGNTGLTPQKKIFVNYADNSPATFQVVMWATPEDMTVDVNFLLVDFEGQPVKNVDVISYRATAQSSGGSSTLNQQDLTPASNQMTVDGNTQSLIDVGRTVTTEISVDNIVIEEPYRIFTGPTSQEKVFKTFEGDNTVTFEIVVIPQ